MLKKLFVFVVILSFTSVFANQGNYKVNTKTLKVRAGASATAPHSYSIYKNKKVTVYEMKEGWARISKKMSNSKWVYAKFLTKIEQNNIIKKTKTPIKETKPEPETTPKIKTKKQEIKKQKTIVQKNKVKKSTSGTNYELIQAISTSDNYTKYKDIFIAASQKLYSHKICNISDLRKTRGWIELFEDEIYFTYCGGYKRKNKIYLNVKNGTVSQ